MTAKPRIVFDSNVVISHLLLPRTTVGRAFRKALDTAVLLVSDETLWELAEVLGRAKFDRYLTVAERQEFLGRYIGVAEHVAIIRALRVCRDPRDDKFLSLAVAGAAHFIVTGDQDLLTLDPFEAVRIMTPSDYLAW